MAYIRDLTTWYDSKGETMAEEAIRQTFQGYQKAWPTGYLVLMDKLPGMNYKTIMEWVKSNKTGRINVHSHAAIAIVFFEVYDDAIAFYLTYSK